MDTRAVTQFPLLPPPQLPTEGEVTIPLDVTLPPQMPPLLYPPLKKKKIIRQFMLMFNVGGRAP